MALRETVERSPAAVQVITVADRESDFFEFLTQAKEYRALCILIRARTDRLSSCPKRAKGLSSMLEALAERRRRSGAITVEVPGNGSRKARTASVEVRVAQVAIKAPQRRGAHAKASGSSEPVSGHRSSVRPSRSAASRHRGDQLGVADEPARQLTSSLPLRRYSWYGKRWGIETWHKVLKSGCKVEDCLLEEAAAPDALSDPLQHHRRTPDARGIPRSRAP